MTMTTWFGVYSLVMVLLFLLRRVVGLFWTSAGFFVATIGYLVYGFDPPVPASVVGEYTVVLVVALLLYVTSSEEGRKDFFGPIISVIVKPGLWPIRSILLLAIPGIIAWQTYQASLPSDVAPPRIRSVHPSPPNSITAQGPHFEEPLPFDLIKGDSPIRALEKSDPETFSKKVAQGKDVYYQNCYYCHGDHLAADGHYATAVKPPPANFQDPGTIAMLQETYLFWRIAKGGPGLPDAATPWDSSMPAWEKMLSESEMWNVIAFMYDYTGYRPRTKEDHGGDH